MSECAFHLICARLAFDGFHVIASRHHTSERSRKSAALVGVLMVCPVLVVILVLSRNEWPPPFNFWTVYLWAIRFDNLSFNTNGQFSNESSQPLKTVCEQRTKRLIMVYWRNKSFQGSLRLSLHGVNERTSKHTKYINSIIESHMPGRM